MPRMTLDDTLHATVQITHEHGLPMWGVHVGAGRVQVSCDPADWQWWTPWLTATPADEERVVAWLHQDGKVCVHVTGVREGIEWVLAQSIPADVATPVLAAFGVTVTTAQEPIDPAVVVALTSRYGDARDTAQVGGVAA